MNKDFERIRDIDAYLSGELSREEAEAFEQKLQEDESLRKDIAAAQKVMEGIEGYAFKQFLSQLSHEPRRTKGKTRRIVNLQYAVGIAASLLIISVVTYLIIPSGTPRFQSYFTPFPAPAETRSTEEAVLPPTALKYYTQEEFGKAIAEMEKIDSSNRSDGMWFYLGVSYLGNERPSEALKNFEKIQSSSYKELVRWYVALCYLEMKQEQKASTELSKIKKDEYQYENARKILRSLASRSSSTE